MAITVLVDRVLPGSPTCCRSGSRSTWHCRWAVSTFRFRGINRSTRCSASSVSPCCSGCGASRRHGVAAGRDLAKIGIGAWLSAASNLMLVVEIVRAGATPVHPVWPFLYCAGQDCIPVLLADAAGARLACRACEGRCVHDGTGVHESVLREQRLIRWIGRFWLGCGQWNCWAMHTWRSARRAEC